MRVQVGGERHPGVAVFTERPLNSARISLRDPQISPPVPFNVATEHLPAFLKSKFVLFLWS